MIAYLVTEIDSTDTHVLGVKRHLGDAVDLVAHTDAELEESLVDQGRVFDRMSFRIREELSDEPPSLDLSVQVSSESISVDYVIQAIELDEREFGIGR